MNAIAELLEEVDRRMFVPPEYRERAGADVPLPIGHGQTISQPSVVQLMLEWLDPQPNEKILDVGSGSGWTTALLARAVGTKGSVYAVEIVPELVETGRENCVRAGVTNTQFFQAGGELGLPEYAPYDRILVRAAATNITDELRGQLKVGGRLVVPVQNDILVLTKTSETNWRTETYPGFMFVPLL